MTAEIPLFAIEGRVRRRGADRRRCARTTARTRILRQAVSNRAILTGSARRPQAPALSRRSSVSSLRSARRPAHGAGRRHRRGSMTRALACRRHRAGCATTTPAATSVAIPFLDSQMSPRDPVDARGAVVAGFRRARSAKLADGGRWYYTWLGAEPASRTEAMRSPSTRRERHVTGARARRRFDHERRPRHPRLARATPRRSSWLSADTGAVYSVARGGTGGHRRDFAGRTWIAGTTATRASRLPDAFVEGAEPAALDRARLWAPHAVCDLSEARTRRARRGLRSILAATSISRGRPRRRRFRRGARFR